MVKSKETRRHEIQSFPEDYGKFPYIIWRVFPAHYMQIPVRFVRNDWKRTGDKGPFFGTRDPNISTDELFNLHIDSIKEVTEEIRQSLMKKRNQETSVCLVKNEGECFYFDQGGITPQSVIPWGGVLLSMAGEIIATHENHFSKKTN